MDGNAEDIKSIKLTVLLVLIVECIFPSLQKRKHDFTQREAGLDYAFDPENHYKGGYLTGQNKNIKQGDLIILKVNQRFKKYEVEEIDYYSSPRDMWTAKLIDLSCLCWLIPKLL